MNLKNRILQAGFTMIELLVVIAVIGVLAVAVLSSINPIEQINKGRDTRTRSDAAQLINATDRFFASQERYPWNDNSFACGLGESCTTPLAGDQLDPAAAFPEDLTDVCTPVGSGIGEGMCQIDAEGGRWMDGLLDTAEVKSGFLERVRAQTTYAVYVYKALGAQEPMYSCFRPSSNSFQQEAVNNCRNASMVDSWPAALVAAACPGANAGEPEYAQTTDRSELICLP